MNCSAAMSTTKLTAHLTPSHLLPKIRMEQEKVLELNFQRNKNPTGLDVTLVAAEAGLQESDVIKEGFGARIAHVIQCYNTGYKWCCTGSKWYQHRLACWRKEQGLPANSGTVLD